MHVNFLAGIQLEAVQQFFICKTYINSTTLAVHTIQIHAIKDFTTNVKP